MMQRYLVEKTVTLAGKRYEPGDVIRLSGERGAVMVAVGTLTLLPQDPPIPLLHRTVE